MSDFKMPKLCCANNKWNLGMNSRMENMHAVTSNVKLEARRTTTFLKTSLKYHHHLFEDAELSMVSIVFTAMARAYA